MVPPLAVIIIVRSCFFFHKSLNLHDIIFISICSLCVFAKDPSIDDKGMYNSIRKISCYRNQYMNGKIFYNQYKNVCKAPIHFRNCGRELDFSLKYFYLLSGQNKIHNASIAQYMLFVKLIKKLGVDSNEQKRPSWS